jgi:hypothetical protein
MIARILLLAIGTLAVANVSAQQNRDDLSINGFKHWRTGHDINTIQLIPENGNNAIISMGVETIVHVKFNVKQYGEVSFPINSKTPIGEEALSSDLSKSKFITIIYKSNHDVVLQLRQTGVHGGIHNHVVISASNEFKELTLYFSEFEGGLKPLNLNDVAKFNFAFLANNDKDGYAELVIRNFQIDQYKPQ